MFYLPCFLVFTYPFVLISIQVSEEENRDVVFFLFFFSYLSFLFVFVHSSFFVLACSDKIYESFSNTSERIKIPNYIAVTVAVTCSRNVVSKVIG